jgi:hypothetical protein
VLYEDVCVCACVRVCVFEVRDSCMCMCSHLCISLLCVY